MTTVYISGIKRHVSNGTTHSHLRASGEAITGEHDLGIERETPKRIMAHESDAASLVYEQGGNRSREADKATRALNPKHRKTEA